MTKKRKQTDGQPNNEIAGHNHKPISRQLKLINLNFTNSNLELFPLFN
jgi:hypothetical protein